MSVDALIDELVAAVVARGRPAPSAPADGRPLARLEEEIAPLGLPPALRRLWERLDVRTLQLDLWPRLSDPEFALNGWLMLRDSTLPEPVGLFPWCYEGHQHLLIELAAPGAAVGTIFEWGFGGDDYRLLCASLEDWLELAARAVRTGTTDSEGFRSLADARLDERGPHPVYGDRRVIGESDDEWPPHWAPITELARRLPPLGVPVLSVAEVQAARREREVRAAVVGNKFYAASGDAGTRLVVFDGTGALDVLCPKGVRGAGYLEGDRVCMEIVAEQWVGPRPASDWAGATFSELLSRFPPDAVAVEIRPSD